MLNAKNRRLWEGLLPSRKGKLKLLMVLYPILIAQGFAEAETFCALTVHIERSDGQPPRSTWVNLTDPEGTVVRSDLVRGDTYRVCDFGSGPHSLTIGRNQCHPTTISNLHLRMGRPILLRVRLQACPIYNTEFTGCQLLFRLRDEQGKSVQGGTILLGNTALEGSSDAFGRLFFHFAAGEKEFEAAAGGQRSDSLKLPCKDFTYLDQTMVLHPVTAEGGK